MSTTFTIGFLLVVIILFELAIILLFIQAIKLRKTNSELRQRIVERRRNMLRDEPIARCELCNGLVWWDDIELVWGCDCITTIERLDEDGLPGIMNADWPPRWRELDE